mmetsp:Transcript_43152/g.113587  ORF Transcript_43152/g.113587 Transcript_43152/m.113587 type:complete len:202 (-) Transcript_43152:64-669(-)
MLPDEIVQRSTERSRLERPTFYACAASMPEAQVLVPAGLQLWPFKVSGRRHELGRLCGRAQPNAATAVGCAQHPRCHKSFLGDECAPSKGVRCWWLLRQPHCVWLRAGRRQSRSSLGEFVTKSESGCRTAVRGHTAQLRMAISRVRLFADGLSKAKVSRKDVHGDCCSDRGSVCSGEGTRDAASPVTKPAQILKSLAYQEL